MYIVKDKFKEKTNILLIPSIYEKIENCLERTGIIYKHSKFNIRYGSYDKLYDYQEVTTENSYQYIKELRMLNKAIHREKGKNDWTMSVSHKAILMFYDEFMKMYEMLFVFGVGKNVKNI